MGRPAFEPTDDQRKHVEAHAAYGTPQYAIAQILGISQDTLAKHFATELDAGLAKANARVAESLFLQAVGAPAQFDPAGNVIRAEQPRVTSAAIFWLKTRAGWSEYRAPPPDRPAPKTAAPGKKAAAVEEAKTAHVGSDWGTVLQ